MTNIAITGASSGLGKALALDLAGQGSQVSVLARSEDKLNELKSQHPDHIDVYRIDISRSSEVKEIFTAILGKNGHLDVLINNAGVFHAAPFYEEDIATIDRIIDTNLKGTMYCTLAVLPSMVARKSGRIINISSVAGVHGIPGQAVYGASKHGMQGFSDVIAQDLQEHNVLVTNICPGGIDTALWNDTTNPYPGGRDNLIPPGEIVELVNFVLARPRTIYKNLVFFPKTEWH